jgi:tetratricopeptide (TPR) repeat protein
VAFGLRWQPRPNATGNSPPKPDRGDVALSSNIGSYFGPLFCEDPQNYLAFDRLGLTYEQNGQADNAIQAYTHEMAFESLGKQRLADLYCNIGSQHQQQKDYAAAAAAYRKSIEFGIADNKSCPVEPSGNPKLIEQEKKESSRAN